VADPETSVDPHTGANDKTQYGSDHDRLLEEIERQKEEIMRLRDLLIGKDAELGRVKGRLAELEERVRRYSRIVELPGLRMLAAVARRSRVLRGSNR
jgi:hypothetical protein